MTIHRRTLIKDMFILVPAGYAGMPRLSAFVKPSFDNKKVIEAGKHYIYTHLLNPREYPDDTRRFVKPPDWNTFNNITQFTTLRRFQLKDNRIVHYKEDLDLYTKVYELGNVIWPFHDFLRAENLPELVDEFKQRRLFLFDIWGYVPGSGPGTWEQFKLPRNISSLLIDKLGDHWLGMDNGEQDGRYIGGYASQMYPQSADRVYQYFNFQRHFERLTDDLGNRMATLVSLNYGHYFLKEGVYTLIGAETAQGLPNGQIYYSFIRGAGKQYGVPWFGNASVWNRWGHKTYNSTGKDYGPTKGTSLSLLKRLMYCHILYNAMTVGFEADWLYPKKIASTSAFDRDHALTPIGHIQQKAVKWVRKNGQPGVMYTPVALMLDFFAGWTFPRHLYSSHVYRVWGNLPYQAGDYLTDGVLSMLYPGYQNSSYYHDETGFMTATPFGDIADCLLSDAESWLLERYPVLVIAGGLSAGSELHDKLQKYVIKGGHLVITAGNLSKFTEGLGGIKAKAAPKHFSKGQTIHLKKERITEDAPFDLYPLSFPEHARVLALVNDIPAVVTAGLEQGKITVITIPYGISSGNIIPNEEELQSKDDQPLPKPYPMLKHVQAILNGIFSSQMLFSVDDGLSLVACCKGKGEYTIGIANNTWQEKPINIRSHGGSIKSIKELPLDQSEKTAVGYLPEVVSKEQIGHSGENTIAGGDIRIFSLQVEEQNVEQIPHSVLPSRPQNRFLPLRNIQQIKEEILKRPTFFVHFDGVVVDWKYLEQREKIVLQKEAGWIGRQKLKMIIDLTSGVDLYPELRLIDNLHADYEASMNKIEDVIDKMGIFHATELILPLHRFPENNFTRQQTWDSFKTTFIRLCKYAKILGINLNLRLTLGRPPYSIKEAVDFVENVGYANLRLAPETAFILRKIADIEKDIAIIKGKAGLWLVSGLKKDVEGKYWNQNVPLFSYESKETLFTIIHSIPDIPIVLDALYQSQDGEYRDAMVLSGDVS